MSTTRIPMLIALLAVFFLGAVFMRISNTPSSEALPTSWATVPYPLPTIISTETPDPKVTPQEILNELTAYPIPTEIPILPTADFCLQKNEIKTFTHSELGYSFTYDGSSKVNVDTVYDPDVVLIDIYPHCFNGSKCPSFDTIGISMESNLAHLPLQQFLLNKIDSSASRTALLSISQPKIMDGVEGILIENALDYDQEVFTKVARTTPSVFFSYHDWIVNINVLPKGRRMEGEIVMDRPCEGTLQYFQQIIDSWKWEEVNK